MNNWVNRWIAALVVWWLSILPESLHDLWRPELWAIFYKISIKKKNSNIASKPRKSPSLKMMHHTLLREETSPSDTWGERQGFHPHLRKIDNPNHLSVGVFSDWNDALWHPCQEEESHVPTQAAVSSARPACELSQVSLKIIGLITLFFFFLL